MRGDERAERRPLTAGRERPGIAVGQDRGIVGQERGAECPGGAQSFAQPTCSSMAATPDQFMETLGAY